MHVSHCNPPPGESRKGLWVICELLFDWWANQSGTKDFINNRHPATNQQSSTLTHTHSLISTHTHTSHKHTYTHLSTLTSQPMGQSRCGVYGVYVWDISNTTECYHKVSSNTLAISSGRAERSENAYGSLVFFWEYPRTLNPNRSACGFSPSTFWPVSHSLCFWWRVGLFDGRGKNKKNVKKK